MRGNDCGRGRQSGYLLLPVAVAIALIGVIAFLISSESAIEVDMTANELETSRAEYVAQAGLQHALRNHAEQGCGPYTDLTTVAFGSDEYDTRLTHDLGGTTPYTSSVDQDAWIRNDQPTVNKGTDLKLHTRFEGGNIEYPLLRYDLSSIPAKAAVLSATAWFYLTNVHPEGPVDLHPLTADWTEADATWDSMNASIGASVIASIPAQATAGTWVPVNLTSQVQAWVNGEANHGIALGTTSEGSHGQYNSRESANAPYLEVTIGTPPTSPTKLKSTSKLDGGGAATVERDDVYLHQSPPSFVQLTLNDGAGQDAMLDSFYSSRNYGNHEIEVETIGSDENSLVRFDLPAIPPGARIISARLELYHYVTESTQVNPGVDVYRVTRDWVEGTLDGTGTADGATWQTWDGSSNWTQNGGDHDVSPVASSDISAAINDWESWEIGELVQGWVDGTFPNYGLLLKGTGSIEVRFASKEDADPALRPKLSITYSCECGTVCAAPQGSGSIALIGDDNSPDPDDQMKIRIIESWGYDVDFYEDQDSNTINWSNYDLAYVSETVITSDVSANLENVSIAVVNEEPKLYDDLELASGDTEHVGSRIDIVDNSHFITSIFPQGPLSIYAGDMEILTADTPLAPGLQTLAEYSGAASLTATDKGAQTISGTAADRRVTLPLGQHFAGGFDWSRLNNNGYLLVQRAIEWGMNKKGLAAAAPGIWVSTLGDVTGSGAPGLDAWTDGEAISFEDPNLLLEPGPTDGSFVSQINIDDFAGDADIDAIHFVGSAITVGSGGNSFDLLEGDLLLSTEADETLNSSNSLTVNDEDVFVFRPDTANDYGAGTFTLLLDGSQIHGESDTLALSLVEKDTSVGDALVSAGTFLFNTNTRRDVQTFVPAGVGLGTTSGTVGELVDGPDVNLGSEIRGLDLAEDKFTLGAHTVPRGAILMTLNNDGSNSGDNGVPTDSEDIFYLIMTQTGASSIGDATLLFDGSDVNLDTSNEHLQALSIRAPPGGFPELPPELLFVVADPASLTAQETSRKDLIEAWGYVVNLIDDGASQAEMDAAAAVVDVVYVSGNIGGGALADKLTDSPAPIVNEFYGKLDNFGFSSSTLSTVNASDFTYTNPSHYITESFSGAVVTVFNSTLTMPVPGGTLAPGLQLAAVVINTEKNPGIVTLDSGATRWDGAPSPGRRVHLPFASAGTAELTADGAILVRRAIEWAGGAVIDLGPVAHWKLDETSGTTAVDSEGGHDGTLVGTPDWVTGLVDGALDHDGGSDGVQVPHSGELSITEALTLMAWVRSDGFGGYDLVLSKGNTGPGWNYYFGALDDEILFGLHDGSYHDFTTSGLALAPDTWHHVTATFDNGADTIKLYHNGIEVHSANTTLNLVANGNDIYLGQSENGAYWDGLLDEVRIYNRVLSASEIQDIHDAGAPAVVGYTELYEPWSATVADDWETVSLASFGVPANAVVEVAVINADGGRENYAGVRAVGSSLERRFHLQEAEAGGIDTVTLHVQADASSQIQHYVDRTDRVSMVALGYWTGASYVELFETFSVGSSNSWVPEDVSDEGLAANQVAEVVVVNTSSGNERLAGVRPVGATYQRRFMLHEAEMGGIDTVSMMVTTNGDAEVEAYASNAGDVEFTVVGYWDTPPGTYTATGGAHGSVSAPTSWETIDLTGYGVPADSIAQFVLANENQGSENSMRVREVGSTINNRALLLHEAEAGGSDLGSLHANVDASSQVQWAAGQGSTGGLFYPVGWWVLP